MIFNSSKYLALLAIFPSFIYGQEEKGFSTAYPPKKDITLFALKSNLLADALLAPNIEVEKRVGPTRRYSVMGEVWFPWYVWKNDSRAYQLLNIGIEGRHWWRISHHPQQQVFAGVYVAGGKYDFEWNNKGRQGEYFSGGITGGWTKRLSKKLQIEISMGLGWVSGPQRCYTAPCPNRQLRWYKDAHLSYFGPTKLKISIIRIVGKKHKKSSMP